MLRRLCGRKKAACLLGGGIYALFAAFGWQAEHNGGCHPALALGIAAVLLLPGRRRCWHGFLKRARRGKGLAMKKRLEQAERMPSFWRAMCRCC